MSALAAATTSNSVQDFAAKGHWDTVIEATGGAVFGGFSAFKFLTTPRTKVYRSVSEAEANSIRTQNKFTLADGGMECKQFGFSLSETRQFGNIMGQNTIVSAKVPTNMLGQLYTGGVDPTIFKSGTLTVPYDMMGPFNQAVQGTIKFMK